MNIYDEIKAERAKQDGDFGPDQDDTTKTPEDWCEDVTAYTTWAKQMARQGGLSRYRQRMMQAAALAVAACESYDRIHSDRSS